MGTDPTIVPAGVVFVLPSVPLVLPFFSEPLVNSMSCVVAVLRLALSRLFRESEEKTSEVADDSIRLCEVGGTEGRGGGERIHRKEVQPKP